MSTLFDDLLTSIHALAGLESSNQLKIVMKSSSSVFGLNFNLLYVKHFSDLQVVGDYFLIIKSQLTLHFKDQVRFSLI